MRIHHAILAVFAVRFTRQNFGVLILAASLAYSGLYLAGVFHPMSLRMRAHGGVQRAVAIALGSLTLKGVILATGAILAFWPARKDS
jgi:hypothetical protein